MDGAIASAGQGRRRSGRGSVWLGAALAVAFAGCAPKPPPKVHLFVETDGDFLSYKPSVLTAPTGADVTVTFHHAGSIITQDHDWVLALPGMLAPLLAESDKLANTGVDEGKSFIKPGDPRVIAATQPIGKGQTATVEFIAPAPGDYAFFCSTPGHADTMRGVLHVTAK